MRFFPAIGSPGRSPSSVALFGSGLLGSAIADELERVGSSVATSFAVDWRDPEARRLQLEAIAERVAVESATSRRVVVIWAAGRCGFRSSSAAVEDELESFERVLDVARSLAPESPGRVVFGMLSSVGGLFEGRRRVVASTPPAPTRPYGHLKLAQERRLLDADDLVPAIFRLTSVFGRPVPGQRKGLISVLVANGVRQATTRIYGRPSTLRDFVWRRDVARYVVRALLSPERPTSPVQMLGAGKPCSIHELITLVERILGRKIHLSYDLDLGNDADITLAPECLPPSWRPTQIEPAVRRVVARVLA